MIEEKFNQFINSLKSNLSINITSIGDIELPHNLIIDRIKHRLLKKEILFDDKYLDYIKIIDLEISWESTLKNVDYVLTGGFLINGITDSLTMYSDFWKGAFSLAPDAEVPEELKHFEQLGWFERQARDLDGRYGCFIKQSGDFPPPLAFYNRGWYTKLEMNLEEYLTTMFENYAVKGWQFFYIDVTEDIPYLDDVLKDMRKASEQLPLLFPDKDWSYHINKYEETKRTLGR